MPFVVVLARLVLLGALVGRALGWWRRGRGGQGEEWAGRRLGPLDEPRCGLPIRHCLWRRGAALVIGDWRGCATVRRWRRSGCATHPRGL